MKEAYLYKTPIILPNVGPKEERKKLKRQSDGPKFDQEFIKALKHRNIKTILKLDKKYPEAGECGLRSFCFLLGILEAHSAISDQTWQTEILSYEAPFGVGYLVANFKIL